MSNDLFYYRVRGYPKQYVIKRSAIELIGLFKQMCDLNKTVGDTPDTAMELEIVCIGDSSQSQTYNINTPELIDWIDTYIHIWEDTPALADYLKEEVIQTSHPEQIIKELDLLYIQKYIDFEYTKLSDEERTNVDKTLLSKKYFQIKALNLLIRNADGYLLIDSLVHKLYAFIATVLWNCSMLELDEARDTHFQQLQSDAAKEYVLQHSHNYVKSNTTGSGDNVDLI